MQVVIQIVKFKKIFNKTPNLISNIFLLMSEVLVMEFIFEFVHSPK